MVTPPIQVANVGMADTLILMVLALVVFGPRRLPQIGRQIGKLMYEFRKASNDFKYQMEEELRNAEEADRRKQEEERLRALAIAAPAQPAATPASPANPYPSVTADSPYPEEGHYPPLTAPAPDPLPDETHPLIQPPTTGEQVQATPPGSAIAQPAPAAESIPEAGQDSNPPAAAESAVVSPPAPSETNSAPETVNHHG
ncbi:MAG: twin-arginine translocase TatA/TatE family subunit [Terracidiphilus sp.]|jgi:sec-independent protein translocase protein TatB